MILATLVVQALKVTLVQLVNLALVEVNLVLEVSKALTAFPVPKENPVINQFLQ